MSKVLKDSGIIILVSILLALVYNRIAEKPLALIAEPPKKVNLNTLDSLASIVAPKSDTNIAISKNEVVSNEKIETKKDTLSKSIAKISKEELQKKEVEQIRQEASKEKENLQKTVTYEQVKEKLNDNRFYFIDARNADDYAKAHIGNSVNIFPHSDDQGKYMERIFTLPRDKVFIIYCNGGTCDLSHKLANDMINAGHKNIFIYVGGWEEWTQKGNK